MDNRTSAIIAFDLAGDPVLTSLQSNYPNPVSDLHITLIYMGDDFGSAEEVDVQTKISKLSNALETFAALHAPIDGRFNGYALFGSDNGNGCAVVTLFDSPQFPAFRQALWRVLPSECRIEQNHGFTPHATLAYVNYPIKLPGKLIDYPLRLDTISIFYGGEKMSFRLVGDRVEKELPIDDRSIPQLVKVRIDVFKTDVDILAEQVYTGQISIGRWEETMKRLVREMHTAAAAIGKGGWGDMTQSDWGKVGAQVKKQYRALHGFAEDIAANRDTVALGSIKARAHMYGEAAGNTAILMQAHGEILVNLPYLPKDGSTECLTNCHCKWVLRVIDRSKTKKLVEATWVLGEADHCMTCVDRMGKRVVFSVSLSTKVPAFIGGI